MSRNHLRSLLWIIGTREQGGSTSEIEAIVRAKRNKTIAERYQKTSNLRLWLVCFVFCGCFATLVVRIGMVSLSKQPMVQRQIKEAPLNAFRRDIVDRNGRILATNIPTSVLYAHPHLMIDHEITAKKLSGLFPEKNYEKLVAQFSKPNRKFLWIEDRISAEKRQKVRDIGEPGLVFGTRHMRVYPNGRLAAHILGGTRIDKMAANSAELTGVSGVERYFNKELMHPSHGNEPLPLSIDISVQAALEKVLLDGMAYFDSLAAGGVLMDIYTGEIIAMASLPDYDPNKLPRFNSKIEKSKNPLINRNTHGLYEFGSVMKAFTIANALDRAEITAQTLINTQSPFWVGKRKVTDSYKLKPALTVADVLKKSSNVGTVRIALQTGIPAQKELFNKLGFLDGVSLEISGLSKQKTLYPKKWTKYDSISMAFGYSIGLTPVHLAAAYAAFGNGGYKIRPTLLRSDTTDARGDAVFTPQTAQTMLQMLRRVVAEEDGTATQAEVPGYEVVGKTGTAEKIGADKKYDKTRVRSVFASVFPASAPKYSLVVFLDEPKIKINGEEKRTAGWTAVPVAGEIISRVAPILDMRPIAPKKQMTYKMAKY